MNTVWSDNVQGFSTLFPSRRLRFDDLFFEQYSKLFDLDRDKELKILEIGCGPGALAEALHRWYPKAQITGIDRDTIFVRFAKENVPGAKFTTGDATALPFSDVTFDVTISHTVSEHIEPSAFWGEQLRVLKPGGVCLCLSASPRRGVTRKAKCLEPTEEEIDFWNSLPDAAAEMKKLEVCRYPMTEDELPAAMENYGFRCVTTGYVVIDLTPDDPKYPPKLAEAMIKAERQGENDSLQRARINYSADTKRMEDIVNAKYDERLRLYRAGEKQWDTAVSVIMVLRGIKDERSV